MRILITGSRGYIGTLITDKLKKEPNIEVVECDRISGCGFEFSTGVFDVIIHLAASPGIPWGEQHKLECIKNNIVNTLQLLNNCRFNKFIFASTGAVYNNQGELEPKSLYGITKLTIERYLQEMYPYKSYIVRIANPVGLYPVHRQGAKNKTIGQHLFLKLAYSYIYNMEFVIHDSETMARDFIPLDVVADIFYRLTIGEFTPGVYFAGYGIKTLVTPMLIDLCKKFNIKYRIEPPLSNNENDFVFSPQTTYEVLFGKDFYRIPFNPEQTLKNYIGILTQ